ncbi:hypothetical protein VY88_27115 [Azospirillum thiophilum]|uniref:Uncharacterized protein n=1 Tax=Azospirillum thiophilum TaxID=528244 RepID=A0AAC8ZWV0_9PROT|nr:hypothetical protein [Azospirillum thiophilum]ALG75175.1 hypothetical protein AL072_30015 [Azospirillum thiophilum]KJR62569.1 hypothetical protein VY88_27115 [Azospirillum thiophilum]
MPREAFVQKRFSAKNEEVILQANDIIADYQRQGFTLTLRQLYYQFVARALIPNTMQSYKRLGQIVNDGRMAGLIDWEAIEDRTRNLQRVSTWTDPESIIDACASQFRVDRWADQPAHVEVWIEKEALVGVIEPVCTDFYVPFFACRGYTSQSEQWRAGRRLRQKHRDGKRVVVLHLGDHDPSGLDMTRDNGDRLGLFAGDADMIEIRRLALNMDQVRRYRPPPNPAKEADSRFADYIKRHGDQSWELDALDPTVIDKLIRDQIDGLIDGDAWEAAIAREDEYRAQLERTADRWGDVRDFLYPEGEE